MSFRRTLRKCLKNGNFQAFSVFQYGSKEVRVYLIDIRSHILTLIQSSIEHHKKLYMRKFLEKNTKR